MRNESEMHREMARFADLIRGAERGRRAVFSEFLTPDAQARLIALARREGLVTGLFGGGEDAERAVVGIWQEGLFPDPHRAHYMGRSLCGAAAQGCAGRLFGIRTGKRNAGRYSFGGEQRLCGGASGHCGVS